MTHKGAPMQTKRMSNGAADKALAGAPDGGIRVVKSMVCQV